MKKKLGIQPHKTPKKIKIKPENEAFCEQVKTLWHEGKTDAEIAIILKTERKRVAYFRNYVLKYMPHVKKKLSSQTKQKRGWNYMKYGQQEQVAVESEYRLHGVVVQKCPPRPAHGAYPMRRL